MATIPHSGEATLTRPPQRQPLRALFRADTPGKRALERFYLWFTPCWGGVVGLVMLTGLAERWGDLELMLLGLALCGATLFGPLLVGPRDPASRGAVRQATLRIGLGITVFSLLMNYFGTRYFYEVLHAHYGFHTQLNLNHVPLFLYLITVPYFATYFALLNLGWRVVRRTLAGRNRWLRVPAIGLVPFAVALLESVLNANPFMARLYCFDDLSFALWFGTLLYGLWFVMVMPFWLNWCESDDGRPGLKTVLVSALAATMLCVIVGEVLKHAVAPHVTTVRHGQVGLRDYGPRSCLQRPR